MKLEEAKKLQNIFKSSLNETSRGSFKSDEQKLALKILNYFTNHKKLLLNYLMIILQFYLRLNTKRNSQQMLQRLPIALALVKAGTNSENLLNEIRQIVYSLYQSKKIIEKVYNNIIKSIQI